ncbi:MAG TPA: ABC transporter ATP-binding protein [Lachnospiraceae bacterium]|nr:ABC transporter ATP-binding protein [Lachnospiraceae bacterium]
MNKKEKMSFKVLWPFVCRYKKIFIRMIIFGILVTTFDSIYPLFNRYAINHFIGEGTVDTLAVFIALFGAVILAQSVVDYYNVNDCAKMEMYMDRDLRNSAFSHLQTVSMSYFNQNNVGYIHARVMSDTGKIGEMTAWRLMDLVWNGSYLIFMMILMLAINRRLFLWLLVLVPIDFFLIWLFQKKLIVLNRRIRELNSRITGNFNEGITGARSIKTLVVEKRMQEDFEKDSEEMRRVSVGAGHFSAMFISLVTLMGSTALALVLWKGGQITMDGVIRIGTLSVFMSYALSMIDPIQQIVVTISHLIGIQVNIERFSRLMEEKPDVADSPEVLARYGDIFHPKKENWEPLHGDIEFDHVDFRYPDGEEYVLKDFCLKVPQGTNVAIVGETGAGKSTLVNLVCRFYEPTRGRVLIDGRDARERSLLWLHSSIGYVLQTPHLFSGTVRDNLRYGNPDADDDEIWKALKLVSADDVVRKMDNGLDSEVGEGGDLLSTGEKQLLSFARALLADPKILVLDEATSSIDLMTEHKIQDAIRTVIAGRTSFVVAHRLSTIVGADVILAVKDGKIVEQGTHHELMQRHGYYYELYTRQYADMAADLAAGG